MGAAHSSFTRFNAAWSFINRNLASSSSTTNTNSAGQGWKFL